MYLVTLERLSDGIPRHTTVTRAVLAARKLLNEPASLEAADEIATAALEDSVEVGTCDNATDAAAALDAFSEVGLSATYDLIDGPDDEEEDEYEDPVRAGRCMGVLLAAANGNASAALTIAKLLYKASDDELWLDVQATLLDIFKLDDDPD